MISFAIITFEEISFAKFLYIFNWSFSDKLSIKTLSNLIKNDFSSVITVAVLLSSGFIKPISPITLILSISQILCLCLFFPLKIPSFHLKST
ncbi:TPA: hypothetical protein DEG21_02670 [Patescibacteria group bacterium]|nr:hypothetical protein [Candidatus Gracilibacteria bacterium]HBY74778.1 hypothetical protein [Candidatus Gracilibacteria bacterium]